ncbi:sugar transporter, putative [Streptomyces bingchenggensis BCW-1]|uniref:Sugar transporter, putative n=1 Tax=Streptomyces bingchenggensis (strain BCW-1) TaxID=749414 RepID=D7C7D8_STRBB|nr:MULTISPECIES: MFS transporter [Streptomyces]ADI10492.1 sugar transporter, putative [Streptomyces bingchenggensis BCW-1]
MTETSTSPQQSPTPTAPLYSRRETVLILAFALLGTLFDGAEINLVGYPMAYIADSLHVSTIEIISIATYQGFASIAGGFLFGWLGDAIGRRKTYAMCVLAFGLAALLGGFATGWTTFLLTRLLAGLGMGGLFGLSFSMFTECWKTRRRGAMGGAIQSMFFVGQIITVGVVFACVSALGHDAGWRTGYKLIGAVSLVVAVAAAFWLPESKHWAEYRRALRAGELPERLRPAKIPFTDLVRDGNARVFLTFSGVATATFVASNAIGAYLSTYLLKGQHLPFGRATVIVLIGYVATILAYTLTGYASDLVSRRRAYLWAGVVGTVGFTWFLTLAATGADHVGVRFWADQTFWALMLCAAGFGGFGVMGVWMSELFPTRLRATGSNSTYYIGRGLGAGVFPLAALGLAGTVPLALGLGVIGPALGLLLSFTAPDRTGRTIQSLE